MLPKNYELVNASLGAVMDDLPLKSGQEAALEYDAAYAVTPQRTYWRSNTARPVAGSEPAAGRRTSKKRLMGFPVRRI